MTQKERMNPRRCTNDTQRNHIRNIEKWGVSILSVFPREEDTGDELWTYSIGFWQQYDHPEILIMGLDGSTAGAAINGLNRRIRDQKLRFDTGAVAKDLLSGDYPCFFQRVDPANYGDRLIGDRWFYGDDSYPVVQMIWPDLQRKYPWQEGVDAEVKRLQPLLCSLPLQALQ